MVVSTREFLGKVEPEVGAGLDADDGQCCGCCSACAGRSLEALSWPLLGLSTVGDRPSGVEMAAGWVEIELGAGGTGWPEERDGAVDAEAVLGVNKTVASDAVYRPSRAC